MITFEPCIRNMRSDGFAKVYIRIIKDTKPAYMGTNYLVTKKQIAGTKIKDFSILGQIIPTIKRYVDKLNTINTDKWSVKEVIEYLQMENEVAFSMHSNYLSSLKK